MRPVLWNEEDDALDPAQQAFIDLVRTQAQSWPIDPTDTILVRGYDADGTPLGADGAVGRCGLCLEIVDRERNVSLVVLGVYLQRDGVVGDVVHNQLFTLPGEPTSSGFSASGTLLERAHVASRWFAAFVRRPVARHEWVRAGTVHAHRWVFADTGTPLVEGRERTSMLGPPDRVVAVRTAPW